MLLHSTVFLYISSFTQCLLGWINLHSYYKKSAAERLLDGLGLEFGKNRVCKWSFVSECTVEPHSWAHTMLRILVSWINIPQMSLIAMGKPSSSLSPTSLPSFRRYPIDPPYLEMWIGQLGLWVILGTSAVYARLRGPYPSWNKSIISEPQLNGQTWTCGPQPSQQWLYKPDCWPHSPHWPLFLPLLYASSKLEPWFSFKQHLLHHAYPVS